MLDFCPEDHGYVVETDSWKKYNYDLILNSRFALDSEIDEKKVVDQVFKKKIKVEKEEKKVKKKM